MAGWIAFILGVFIVAFSATKQLGHLYCFPVALGWYVLILKGSKRAKKRS